MSNEAAVLIGLGFMAFLLIAIFQAVQVYAEGGLKPFFWPRLEHGYQVGLVTRLATLPWLLLLFILLGNGLAILLFDHDLLGQPAKRYWPWLAAAVVPVMMIHLVDYQRSLIAAALAFVIIAGIAVLIVYALQSWVAVLAAAPLLLWSLNGLRAAYVERIMG